MKKWQPRKLDRLSKDNKKVLDVLNQGSDLSCVLIGASYLSEFLASTLSAIFIKTTIASKLLDPQRGAIGGFSPRADLAYCLDLIRKNTYQDLLKIAEIRNRFAHGYLELNFGDPVIQKACEKLQAWQVLLKGEEQEFPSDAMEGQLCNQARNQFNISVVLLANRIHLDALGHSRGKGKLESP